MRLRVRKVGQKADIGPERDGEADLPLHVGRRRVVPPSLMADTLSILEMMENRWMRAWVGRDARTLKALTSPQFRMVVGSKPCVILDAASWLEAATSRYLCTSYRFGDSIYARDLGSVAVFATHIDIQASIDRSDWSGQLWVTDLWRKTKVRRNWRMIERVLSRPEESPQVSAAIRSLQLWR